MRDRLSDADEEGADTAVDVRDDDDDEEEENEEDEAG